MTRIRPPTQTQVYQEYVSGAVAPFGIDFDVFERKRRELYGLIVGAFEKCGLLATLVRIGRAPRAAAA